jgi:hypothetical protein
MIIIAGASNLEKEQISTISAIAAQKSELDEFKAGIVRSIKQYNAGLVKTFDNADDFLALPS